MNYGGSINKENNKYFIASKLIELFEGCGNIFILSGRGDGSCFFNCISIFLHLCTFKTPT
jgi:hypothetical protein